MKIRFLFVVILFALAPAIFAQSKSSKITMKPAGLGRVTIIKGAVRSVINLRKDIAGCPYVPAEFKKSLDKKGCSASPAQFKLADAQTKNKVTYVLITVDAMGGCNVCGRCGAGESTTLIWLALDAKLKETDRKSAIIEDCSENIEILNHGNSFVPRGNEVYDLKFVDGVFKIEFEKTTFGDGDDAGYEYSVAEYSRKSPELGLVVKTEKRKESSAK